MTIQPEVVCIGACTLDLITAIDGPLGDDQRVRAREAVLGAGGPSATAAVALARLGIPVAFVGGVGNDAAGQFILAGLEAEGVDVGCVEVRPGSSAMSAIWVRQQTGNRSIAAYYGSAGLPSLDEPILRRCRTARWVHVDHIGYAILAPLRAAGIRTAISVDGGNPIPDFDLRGVDIYAPTEERLMERYPGHSLEQAMASALHEGPNVVVVTRGLDGSVAAVKEAASSSPHIHQARAIPVPVVSTLGAGDVFHGALLAALVRGQDMPQALRFANATAALSCQALDGRSAIPTWEDVERVMGSGT